MQCTENDDKRLANHADATALDKNKNNVGKRLANHAYASAQIKTVPYTI
jgi:hypothetical protein